MEVIVNYPTEKGLIEEFENNLALFQAMLIVDSVDELDIDYTSKQNIIKEIIDKLPKEDEVI